MSRGKKITDSELRYIAHVYIENGLNYSETQRITKYGYRTVKKAVDMYAQKMINASKENKAMTSKKKEKSVIETITEKAASMSNMPTIPDMPSIEESRKATVESGKSLMQIINSMRGEVTTESLTSTQKTMVIEILHKILVGG
jgi:cell envelope opacity-associated protein A